MDSISDLLTRIRNGVKSKKREVNIPSFRLGVEVVKILKEEGYIKNFKVIDDKQAGDPQRDPQVHRGQPERHQRPQAGQHAGLPDLLHPGFRPQGPGRPGPGHRLDVPRRPDAAGLRGAGSGRRSPLQHLVGARRGNHVESREEAHHDTGGRDRHGPSGQDRLRGKEGQAHDAAPAGHHGRPGGADPRPAPVRREPADPGQSRPRPGPGPQRRGRGLAKATSSSWRSSASATRPRSTRASSRSTWAIPGRSSTTSPRASRSSPRSPPCSPSGASTGRRWARSPTTSRASASRTPTSRRASATSARGSSRKNERRG